MTPAPTPHHQKVILRLAVMLIEHVEGRGLGWVFQDVDLLFVSGQFLRPVILVVPAGGRAGITDRGVEIAPALVIEVNERRPPRSAKASFVLTSRCYLNTVMNWFNPL